MYPPLRRVTLLGPARHADLYRNRLDASVGAGDRDPGSGHQSVGVELSQQLGRVVSATSENTLHRGGRVGLEVCQ